MLRNSSSALFCTEDSMKNRQDQNKANNGKLTAYSWDSMYGRKEVTTSPQFKSYVQSPLHIYSEIVRIEQGFRAYRNNYISLHYFITHIIYFYFNDCFSVRLKRQLIVIQFLHYVAPIDRNVLFLII